MTEQIVPISTAEDFVPRRIPKVTGGKASPNDIADAIIKVLENPAAKPIIQTATTFMETMTVKLREQQAAKQAAMQQQQAHNPVLFEG